MPRFPFGTKEEAWSAIHDELGGIRDELVRIRMTLEVVVLEMILEHSGDDMSGRARERHRVLIDRLLEGK